VRQLEKTSDVVKKLKLVGYPLKVRHLCVKLSLVTLL
jgi:hypothetical protein